MATHLYRRLVGTLVASSSFKRMVHGSIPATWKLFFLSFFTFLLLAAMWKGKCEASFYFLSQQDSVSLVLLHVSLLKIFCKGRNISTFVATIKQKYSLRKRRWKERERKKKKKIKVFDTNRVRSVDRSLPRRTRYQRANEPTERLVAVRNLEDMRVVKTLKISVPGAYGTKLWNTAKLFYPKLPFLQVWTKSEGGRSWPPLSEWKSGLCTVCCWD